jgi:hypothetical protein
LIWYWINRNIGLSSIGLNEMYCTSFKFLSLSLCFNIRVVLWIIHCMVTNKRINIILRALSAEIYGNLCHYKIYNFLRRHPWTRMKMIYIYTLHSQVTEYKFSFWFKGGTQENYLHKDKISVDFCWKWVILLYCF